MLVSLRFFGFRCYNHWFSLLQPIGFGATTMLKKRFHNRNQANPKPQPKKRSRRHKTPTTTKRKLAKQTESPC